MNNTESRRKLLNKQQTELRSILLSFTHHEQAIKLFLKHHAMLHSTKMACSELWSYEDEILNNLTEQQLRHIPPKCDHSIAWLIWHIARIEDVTMNLLVAGHPQVLNDANWLEQMNVTVCNTGNAMAKEDVINLSATINLEALRAYRIAVGRKTREIVKQLSIETLKEKVTPTRLQQVITEGAVVEATSGVIDYWANRNIAGLLLMPATRHNIVHLNQALRLKQKFK